jgi:3-deoxy-7-phosphoheptulonate synthase
VVRRLTRLPVAIDPSHSVGKKDVASDGILDIAHVTAQGIIAGANLVLVDFHPNPEQALCDGPQALLLEELEYFVRDTQLVRNAYLERCRLRATLRNGVH